MRSRIDIVRCIPLVLGIASPAAASAATAEGVREARAIRAPSAFVENRGQWDERAAFALDRPGVRTFVTSEGFRFAFEDGAAVFLTFENASPEATVLGIDPQPGRMHYLLGSDPSKWVRDAERFGGVRIRGIRDGVDVDVRATESGLEYDVIMRDGAASGDGISLMFEGADTVETAAGEVIATTRAGRVIQRPPRMYSIDASGTREPAASDVSLDLEGRMRISWNCDSRRATLVVDPEIVFVTMHGGDSGSVPATIVPCADGSIVVGSAGGNLGFPVTSGCFDPTASGWDDCQILRMSADGSQVLYGTYVGGAQSDSVGGLALRPSGEIVAVGSTASPDFPTTPWAIDPTYNGPNDVTVFELSSDGASLLHSTFLGGSKNDGAGLLAIDAFGRICLAGVSNSADWFLPAGGFESTPGPYPTVAHGFVMTLDPTGTSIVGGTFLVNYVGPASSVDVRGLALTIDGKLAVAGRGGLGFPVTTNAFDTSYDAAGDAVIAVLPVDCSTILYSTYLGQSDSDVAQGLAVAPDGDIVIAGDGRVPTTPGSFDPTYQGNTDGFVARFDVQLSTLKYSGAFSSGGYDHCWDVAVDAAGCAYAIGEVNSGSGVPVTQDAFYATHQGLVDCVLLKIDPTGSEVLFGTFFGGTKSDQGLIVRATASGEVLVGGVTYGSDFPTTDGVYDENPAGHLDGFIASFDLCGGSFVEYGATCPAGATAHLSGTGCASPGRTVGLSVTGAPPLAPALLLLGTGQGVVPLSPSCSIAVAPLSLPLAIPLTVSSTGAIELSGTLPSTIGAPWLVTFQLLFAGGPPPLGIGATNALAMNVRY